MRNLAPFDNASAGNGQLDSQYCFSFTTHFNCVNKVYCCLVAFFRDAIHNLAPSVRDHAEKHETADHNAHGHYSEGCTLFNEDETADQRRGVRQVDEGSEELAVEVASYYRAKRSTKDHDRYTDSHEFKHVRANTSLYNLRDTGGCSLFKLKLSQY